MKRQSFKIHSKKVFEICELVLDCFDGITANEWLEQNHYPPFEEMLDYEADMITAELTKIKRERII